MMDLTKNCFHVPYALRRVPREQLATLLSPPRAPQAGDIALAQLESIGKNARLELASGRQCSLHEGDRLAVVFGNRYASRQFEGYARTEGEACDLLSMGGVCGLVASKHEKVLEPSRLRLLGAIGDRDGAALRLRDYALPSIPQRAQPGILVVCGTDMDAGKTYTAMSAIIGLKSRGQRVAAIKLTGTAAGRDAWAMRDAGAEPVFDFVDGGHPSTYLCSLDELLSLHGLLVANACAHGVDWVVIEIADGPLQPETGELLRSSSFKDTVDAWLFAASDSLSAKGGIDLLRKWDIEPLALSGLLTTSPLGMREASAATGMPCLTALELKDGALDDRLAKARRRPVAAS